MRIGIVGRGHAADRDLSRLENRPIFDPGGIIDRDDERARRAARLSRGLPLDPRGGSPAGPAPARREGGDAGKPSLPCLGHGNRRRWGARFPGE